MKKGDLLEVLHMVESKLPLWLTASGIWNTLDVNYEPPRVERLWVALDRLGATGHRAYLHRIHPCQEPLFHPHPWPSAVRVVSGRYEMDLGAESMEDPDPMVLSTIVLSAPSEYEMLEKWGWHSVKPLGCPSLSVMVTGPVWRNGTTPHAHGQLSPLSDETKTELLEAFRHYYKL